MWKRIEDNSGRHHLVKRTYSKDGKQYPRVSVALFPDSNYGGVKVSCNIKEDEGSFWSECGCPEELLPELIEILTEYNSRQR